MKKQLVNNSFARTKILATLGPATDSVEMISGLVNAGADAVRLNFSHGSYKYFEQVFNNIEDVRKSKNIAILQDLQGPKIRLGKLEKPEIEILSGDIIEITSEDIIGTNKIISVSYKPIAKDAKIGDTILIDDGMIKLSVVEIKDVSIVCEIVEGGILKPKKGMNMPGMNLSTPAITEKDIADVLFGKKYNIDYLALSFVRSAKDIVQLREILNENNIKRLIIAKIEKPEAVENFEEILKVVDGIMVARGDLGVEINAQAVPTIQKKIIKRCREEGKLVITATQMFESMINNPVPTRAEVSDVANSVWDGTDVVMLSAETSVGKFPIDAVKIMNDVLLTTEKEYKLNSGFEKTLPIDFEEKLFDSIGFGIVKIAERAGSKAIVVFSHQGRFPTLLSKFRPHLPVFVFSDDREVINKMNLCWGLYPTYFDNVTDKKACIDFAKEYLMQNKFVQSGDLIMVAEAVPVDDNERNNWIKFITIN